MTDHTPEQPWKPDLSWQALTLDKSSRARIKGQRPCVLWLTGLSGAGKSTIANLLEQRLHALGRHTYLLDGDNLRQGLNKDLGFTAADRVENIRRVGELAKLFVDAGLIVIVAFISPFRNERRIARAGVAKGEFFELYVDTPLALCEQRDPKGLYKKARQGQLSNFTGIDSPYEPPENPELILQTAKATPAESVDKIIMALKAAQILD
jgi:bifunctional enzyme CysN/CysC